MVRRADAPWYAQGLRFECQPDCGKCCTNHGGYDYVYLTPADLEPLAAHFGVTPDEFRARHAFEEDGHLALRMEQPECPFLDGVRCTVYEARPTQCRTFPFWPENLRSRQSWRRLVAFCPGIDQGPRHPLALIRGHLAEHRDKA